MKKLSKFVSFIALLTTIIAFLLVAIITIPNLFGVKQYVVLSGSMEPSIPTGSVVFVNSNDKNIEVGDIFTYYVDMTNEKVNVTHRAIEVTDSYVVPKGDANENSDGQIELSRVIGKVVFYIPKLGYLISKSASKGRTIVIGWIIFLNVVSFLLSYFAKTKSREIVN